jgi:hypothetical protein
VNWSVTALGLCFSERGSSLLALGVRGSGGAGSVEGLTRVGKRQPFWGRGKAASGFAKEEAVGAGIGEKRFAPKDSCEVRMAPV